MGQSTLIKVTAEIILEEREDVGTEEEPGGLPFYLQCFISYIKK